MGTLSRTTPVTHPAWCSPDACHAASGGGHASRLLTVDGASLRLVGEAKCPQIMLIIGAPGAERMRVIWSRETSTELRDHLTAILLATCVTGRPL